MNYYRSFLKHIPYRKSLNEVILWREYASLRGQRLSNKMLSAKYEFLSSQFLGRSIMGTSPSFPTPPKTIWAVGYPLGFDGWLIGPGDKHAGSDLGASCLLASLHNASRSCACYWRRKGIGTSGHSLHPDVNSESHNKDWPSKGSPLALKVARLISESPGSFWIYLRPTSQDGTHALQCYLSQEPVPG